MKVSFRGYFTKHKKMEKSALNYAKLVSKKLLSKYPQVKEVKLTFLKNEIGWTNGYHWLWTEATGTIEIVIPGRYRSLPRSKWLVLHEIFHAIQRIEKRLNKSLFKVVYEGKKFYWSAKNNSFVDAKKRKISNPPWEIEVRRRSGKIFGKRNTDLAWPS